MSDYTVMDKSAVMAPASRCNTGGFFGLGELGGTYSLGPLDDGWQRNLTRDFDGPCAAHFAAINVNAQAVATLELNHLKRNKEGGQERIDSSPVARVLNRPNAYQTRSDFVLNQVFNLLAHGNSYAVAMRDNQGKVESLHLAQPGSTLPHVDPDTGAIYYAIGENLLVPEEQQVTMLVPARDVLHVKLHTPNHPLVGVSPIKYAIQAVMVNKAITANQAAFFRNMSRPSGVLTTDLPLTGDQMTALRKAWEAKSQGLASGGVPILGFGLKWDAMTLTSEDAQLIEAYRMSIEDIARVFRVPLALMGDYSKATYANTEQMISSWLSTGLGFLLEHVESAYDRFFGLPPGQSCHFDVDRLLRADFAGRIDGLTKGIVGGLYSPNEARQKEGLPKVEFGDEPRLQSQVVPLSQVNMEPVAPAPAAPAVPVPTGDDETKQLLQGIMDRLDKKDPEPRPERSVPELVYDINRMAS